ncbi:MAG: SH3 domain-containing protein [Clostridia bacterium]|nr:SH3 domain-containing protein [Clostridia bacterium]
MKKILSFILSTVVIMGILVLPQTVSAATTSSKAGVVSVTSGRLNVRSKASTSGAVLTSLTKSSHITLMSKSGDWWYVEYSKGRYGYCHADYIKTASSTAATVKISSGSLNVRSGGGTSYSKVGSLLKGEVVLVLAASKGWSRILYHGTKIGYVSSQYLSTATSGSTTYSAVSLKVPYYSQNDSRWANVKIGSSGKTIGQIGCVTTGIAMMESYHTGKTVYPDAMSKKLSYSSSGNVYWPSNMTAVTGSSGYLSGIYNQLKKGKPVLIGAKTSSGRQHWVVVTGFTGGDSLTASRFTINDPGTKTRTNLQQFLNAYPTFYKYFYYK